MEREEVRVSVAPRVGGRGCRRAEMGGNVEVVLRGIRTEDTIVVVIVIVVVVAMLGTAMVVGVVVVVIIITITFTIALLNVLGHDFVNLLRLHLIETYHLQLRGYRVLELRVPLNKV